jgi:quercetin dioxygenase-like cupin family protein
MIGVNWSDHWTETYMGPDRIVKAVGSTIGYDCNSSFRKPRRILMSLFVAASDVPVQTVDMETTSFETRLVFGTQGSLMVAARPAGYHSPPHVHDCEQLNYLQEGELWIFLEQRAYQLRPGDFLRVPPGVVHWSWNRTEAPCTLIEVHCPGLQDDPKLGSAAVGLFGEGEAASTSGSPRNEFVDYDPTPAEKLVENGAR